MKEPIICPNLTFTTRNFRLSREGFNFFFCYIITRIIFIFLIYFMILMIVSLSTVSSDVNSSV